MKSVFAYLLVISISWHLLASSVIYVSFKINQDYIAKNLCINKDDPESSCHGCCQLKKELEKQQEREKDLPQTETKKIEIQYFSYQIRQISNPNNYRKIPTFFYLKEINCANPNKIFHPPKPLHA